MQFVFMEKKHMATNGVLNPRFDVKFSFDKDRNSGPCDNYDPCLAKYQV